MNGVPLLYKKKSDALNANFCILFIEHSEYVCMDEKVRLFVLLCFFLCCETKPIFH